MSQGRLVVMNTHDRNVPSKILACDLGLHVTHVSLILSLHFLSVSPLSLASIYQI